MDLSISRKGYIEVDGFIHIHIESFTYIYRERVLSISINPYPAQSAYSALTLLPDRSVAPTDGAGGPTFLPPLSPVAAPPLPARQFAPTPWCYPSMGMKKAPTCFPPQSILPSCSAFSANRRSGS